MFAQESRCVMLFRGAAALSLCVAGCAAGCGNVDEATQRGLMRESERVVPALLESHAELLRTAIFSDDRMLRSRALRAALAVEWTTVGEYSDCVLREGLSSRVRQVQERTFEILEGVITTHTAEYHSFVPALRRLIRERSNLSLRAVELLGRVGDRSAIPELLWLYNNQSTLPYIYDASAAPVALARLGYRELIPVLVRDLRTGTVGRKAIAAKVLSAYDSLPREVLDQLVSHTRADFDSLGRYCLVAISKSGIADRKAQEILRLGLASQDADTKISAITAMGQLRDVPRGLIAQLLPWAQRHPLTKIDDISVALAVERALVRIGDNAVPVLVEESLSKRGEDQTDSWPARMLARIPPKGYIALVGNARDQRVHVARIALRAMSTATPSVEARGAFKAFLIDSISARRFYVLALDVVSAQGYVSDEMADVVASIATDTREPVLNRLLAVDVLASMRAESEKARSALRVLSQDADKDIRHAAHSSLRSTPEK